MAKGTKGTPADDNRIPLIQVRHIIEEFGAEVETQPPGWAGGRNPNPIEFMYRRGHLLIRDRDVRRLPDIDVPGGTRRRAPQRPSPACGVHRLLRRPRSPRRRG